MSYIIKDMTRGNLYYGPYEKEEAERILTKYGQEEDLMMYELQGFYEDEKESSDDWTKEQWLEFLSHK